tara:strand:- start:6069 stop:6728 length:660 start_codon:yes stop_codon:yes gene_type:complete
MYWLKLIKAGWSVPGKAFRNPKFVFSFFVIMIISSAGIWAPWAFDINLSSVCNDPILLDSETKASKANEGALLHNQKVLEESCAYVSRQSTILFQGFTIFMFNVGILGGVAFDSFVNQGIKKYEKLDFDKNKIDDLRMNEFAGFFFWVIAFILSFDGLKHPVDISCFALIGTFISISLWICVNYSKTEFNQPIPDPNNIEANSKGNKSTDVELEGSGLE